MSESTECAGARNRGGETCVLQSWEAVAGLYISLQSSWIQCLSNGAEDTTAAWRFLG
jgi:hypothetical protein